MFPKQEVRLSKLIETLMCCNCDKAPVCFNLQQALASCSSPVYATFFHACCIYYYSAGNQMINDCVPFSLHTIVNIKFS